MKQWKLRYELHTSFNQPVRKHSYSLRCFPQEMLSQKVLTCRYEVLPPSRNSRGRDAFGNYILFGCCEEEHTSFWVKVEAVVWTKDTPEPVIMEPHQLGMYRYGTALTYMGDRLKDFYASLPPAKDKNVWSRTEEIMDKLSSSFSYVSGSTGIHTTAEDAFAQGHGVCQDYAHILLSVCRKEGMTARYVAGTIPGEGETHAWVEVLGKEGWKGFDPTHNRPADEDYICFAFGRDAADCGLNRGIFLGNALQQQSVYVKMEEY
ncbi:MAG: transglutaminase domain-containing protein [Blautia sp.]|nr:transglutaminase domain-containing protein [Blautia sp.]